MWTICNVKNDKTLIFWEKVIETVTKIDWHCKKDAVPTNMKVENAKIESKCADEVREEIQVSINL